MQAGDQKDRAGKGRADAFDRAVGSRIRAARRERGLSQTVLGDQVGISFQQIQKYERGDSRMPAAMLIQIAEVLDIRIQGLIDPPVSGVSSGSDEPAIGPTEAEVDALTRAFATLQDPELRAAVLRLVARMADGQAG